MTRALSSRSIEEYLRLSPPLICGYLDLDIQLQPNGFDLSLRQVQTYESRGQLGFSDSRRVLPRFSEVERLDSWLELGPGSYLVTYNEIVNLPSTIVAFGYPRSSLLRMGATIETAVWDAGYRGRSQSLLLVQNPHGVRLEYNARIVQLVFFELTEAFRAYAGAYQQENISLPTSKSD